MSLINIHLLSNSKFASIVEKAESYKKIYKSGAHAQENHAKLLGKTISLLFSKRSTRTRVSTEGAAAFFGAHAMFLGKDDIQLGVNESLYDTTRVLLSMTSCIFARVNKHEEILQLAQHSSVPVINSLCDMYHPLQAIADLLTIKEHFRSTQGLKLVWIGDANNVINDLTIAALKMGISVVVCVPESISMEPIIVEKAGELTSDTVTFEVVHDPSVAVQAANIVVTDTWISMGQESEKQSKLKQFAGFQINQELLKGKVADNWIFMHCLPRHQEEVADDVFYSANSVVFPEAENRLYAAIAAIDEFVISS